MEQMRASARAMPERHLGHKRTKRNRKICEMKLALLPASALREGHAAACPRALHAALRQSQSREQLRTWSWWEAACFSNLIPQRSKLGQLRCIGDRRHGRTVVDGPFRQSHGHSRAQLSQRKEALNGSVTGGRPAQPLLMYM